MKLTQQAYDISHDMALPDRGSIHMLASKAHREAEDAHRKAIRHAPYEVKEDHRELIKQHINAQNYHLLRVGQSSSD